LQLVAVAEPEILVDRVVPEDREVVVAVVLGQADPVAVRDPMAAVAAVVRTLGTHHLVAVGLAEQTQPDQELVIQDLVLGLVTLEILII
jgi:hypothetical protein